MNWEDKEQMNRIEALLIEIAYEVQIFDEDGKYIERQNREREDTDDTNQVDELTEETSKNTIQKIKDMEDDE